MQDLILTKLADIGELKVISRTSTAKYASHPDDLKTIAQQLGVANVLEGSVQKAGNSVLINVQLINARTDAHIWAQAYTRTLDNVFGVEGEVAGKIAGALKAKLSPAETKRLATALSNDPTANDLYLRAQYFVNAANGNSKFLSSLKQAIAFYIGRPWRGCRISRWRMRACLMPKAGWRSTAAVARTSSNSTRMHARRPSRRWIWRRTWPNRTWPSATAITTARVTTLNF